MRIIVSSGNGSKAHNRAYAEYRFFLSIAPYEAQVRAIDVVVRRDPALNQQFLCSAVVDLGSSRRVKTQARAVHPSAAIDRAAERIAWLVGRRLGGDSSLNSPGVSS